MTYQKRLVSYVMRDFSGLANIKYINASESESTIPPKELLFGFDEAPENSVLVAIEGIIDKMKLGRRALATLGTGFTKIQVLRFRTKKPKKIYILFDSEKEAQKIAQDLAFQIWFCPTEIIQLTHHNDPGELTEGEGIELMRQLT
jgi:DNA primase